MRYKKATYIANALFIVFAIAVLAMIAMFPAPMIKLTVGPGYYPAILCVMLIIACVVSSLSTRAKREDPAVPMPKLKNAVLVIAVVVLFLVFWELTGMFYIVSFFALGTLLYCFNPRPDRRRKLTTAVVISACMQAFVYGVFERMMFFNF